MLTSHRLTIRASEIREKLNTLSQVDELSTEQRSELDKLSKEYSDVEAKLRAATIAEAKAEKRALETEPDAEMRERLELRGKASLTAYLRAALSGRRVDGAEQELQEAAGVSDGIPLELWDVTQPEHRQAEHRADASTAAPGTVGVNLDRIRPAVFSQSILPRLGVEMPRVESGTYASATITTSLKAAAKAKGGAQEASAAAFTVTTATPKRISARLGIAIEDVAAVGQANFESALRQNLSLVLGDALDTAGLTGDGQAPNLTGLLQRLTDPTNPSDVANFDAFVAEFAGGIDGLWASTVKDVGIVCGPTTYQLSAKTFRDVGTNNGHRGDVAFSDYAMARYGGFWTNKRMPAAASNIQQGVLYRMGRPGVRTAVCPHWGEISIDDIYSSSGKGERYFTMHVLLGDVILVQPDAYKQVAFKLA